MDERVLGVLSGEDASLALIESWARGAKKIYAADGAAHRLVDLGFRPIVVGDGDSWRPADEMHGLEFRLSSDQETTDCDKMLLAMASDGIRQAVVVGVEGDDLGHVLATLSSCLRSPLAITLWMRRFCCVFVKPGLPIRLELGTNITCSLMPLIACEGVELSGVAWPLKSSELALGMRVSVSNKTNSTVSCSIESGAALFLWERANPLESPWSD